MRERLSLWQGLRNLWGAAVRRRPSAGLIVAVVVLVIVGQAVADYARGLTPVVLTEDGRARHVRTRRTTVGEVLNDLGIRVGPYDHLSPAVDVALKPRMRIEVLHARTVHLTVDGVTHEVQTLAGSAKEILAEAGIELGPGDELRVGSAWAVAAPASALRIEVLRAARTVHLTVDGVTHEVQTLAGSAKEILAEAGIELGPGDELRAGSAWAVAAPASALRIEVLRAARIHLADGGAAQTFYSTASTVGQALSEAGVLLYEGDLVAPGLDAPLSDGLEVHLNRARPVEVHVDGRVLRTRTQSQRVGEVLAEMGVSVVGQDFCDPPLDAPIAEGAQLRVIRVTERTEVEQEELPFETQWVPDDSLELDERYLDDPGAIGIRRRRYKVVYHDRSPVERVLEEDWLAQAPRPRQIAYGTKVVVRTLETPDGPIEYWRRLRVFLTAYTADTCGKARDHPEYGITRLGWPMRHGIIATDPRVIRLRTPLYVPGYGQGIAGDTGSLIVGRHIDLGYEVGRMVGHFEWGYVYLLTPVPAASQIPYILPDYPRGVY